MSEVDAIAVVNEALLEVLENEFDVVEVLRDYVEPVAAFVAPVPLSHLLEIFDRQGLEAAGMQVLIDEDDRRYRTVFAQSEVSVGACRADAV